MWFRGDIVRRKSLLATVWVKGSSRTFWKRISISLQNSFFKAICEVRREIRATSKSRNRLPLLSHPLSWKKKRGEITLIMQDSIVTQWISRLKDRWLTVASRFACFLLDESCSTVESPINMSWTMLPRKIFKFWSMGRKNTGHRGIQGRVHLIPFPSGFRIHAENFITEELMKTNWTTFVCWLFCGSILISFQRIR